MEPDPGDDSQANSSKDARIEGASKTHLLDLIDIDEPPLSLFPDDADLDLDDDNEGGIDFVDTILQNSFGDDGNSPSSNVKKRKIDLVDDDIEEIPDLVKPPAEKKRKGEWSSASSESEVNVIHGNEDMDIDDLIDSSGDDAPRTAKKQKTLVSFMEMASRKKKGRKASVDVLIDGDNDRKTFQIELSDDDDFQTSRSEIALRRKAQNALKVFKKTHQDDVVEDLDPIEAGTKKRGRKRKNFNEDEYSDLEDEEEKKYHVSRKKTKLKEVKSGTGPKFDISEKTDINVPDLVLTPENVTPVVKIPAVVSARLREYQRDGVKFLFKNYYANQGAILGDEMGLGKTIQCVAFLLAVIPPADHFKKQSSLSLDGGVIKGEKDADPDVPEHQKHPVMICCPASVVQNWEREIKTWSALAGRKLSVISYIGDKRKVLLPQIQNSSVQIVLTTFETFRNDFLDGVLKDIEWNCCVFDEIHKIKGKRAKVTIAANGINTRRRFGLTGTVMQNNFDELFTLIDFVRPGRLGSQQSFNNKYIIPIKNGQKRDASPKEIAAAKFSTKHLNGTLKKIVLRRDKTVIEDLLKGKDDHVVFCPMTPLQLAIYRRVLESDEYRILASVQEDCKCGSGYKSIKCCLNEERSSFQWRKKVFPAILNLQKISQHPILIKPAAFQEDEDDADLAERERFHKRAFGDDAETIEKLVQQNEDHQLSGKIKTLLSLLPIWSNQGHKVLLFSYSTRTLDILQRIIAKNGLTFSRIDGSVPAGQRQGIIDRFNEQDHIQQFMMLISTKAGGLGLNITSANIVVVFDASWNVTHDLQAQDRAYRIGQTKHTDVYRLISVGTIEELIYQRQVYKQQMANIGMQGFDERRYFKGVHGVKGEEGELFGLTNLLKLNTESILSKDLVDRVEEDEKAIYRIEKSGLQPPDEKDKELSSIFDKDIDKKPDNAAVIDLDDPNPPPPAQHYSQASFSTQLTTQVTINSAGLLISGIDPLTQAMLKSGVVYMHKNNAIIGDNEIEKRKAKEAAELYRKDLEVGRLASFIDDEDAPLSPDTPEKYPIGTQTIDEAERLRQGRLKVQNQREYQYLKDAETLRAEASQYQTQMRANGITQHPQFKIIDRNPVVPNLSKLGTKRMQKIVSAPNPVNIAPAGIMDPRYLHSMPIQNQTQLHTTTLNPTQFYSNPASISSQPRINQSFASYPNGIPPPYYAASLPSAGNSFVMPAGISEKAYFDYLNGTSRRLSSGTPGPNLLQANQKLYTQRPNAPTIDMSAAFSPKPSVSLPSNLANAANLADFNAIANRSVAPPKPQNGSAPNGNQTDVPPPLKRKDSVVITIDD